MEGGMLRKQTRHQSPRGGFELRALPTLLSITVAVALVAWSATAHATDLTPYQEDWVVEIITLDPDGERRETKVWVAVLDDAAYVRTNDSRWLANIRRLPDVLLRTRQQEESFGAEVDDDKALYDRVEEAFQEKYGLIQKLMSAMRVGRPTVIRLTPRAAD
jgi:hypothetical protein